MATHAKTGFEEATSAFLDYLSSYRGYSPHTVKAYARDLRMFREFLFLLRDSETTGRCQASLRPVSGRFGAFPPGLLHCPPGGLRLLLPHMLTGGQDRVRSKAAVSSPRLTSHVAERPGPAKWSHSRLTRTSGLTFARQGPAASSTTTIASPLDGVPCPLHRRGLLPRA